MQSRFFFAFACVLLAAAGCGSIKSDPRGQFTGFGACDAGPAYCGARHRAWGAL